MYEGYGPGGVAFVLEILTDNKNRTAGDVRAIFTKGGGSMAASGAVAFQFERKGVVPVKKGPSEDQVMEAALDAGAEDIITNEDGSLEVITGPNEFSAVKAALDKAGFKPELAEVTMKPTTENELKGNDAARMQKLLDALEAVDDVQEVYTTALLEQ